MVSQLQSVYIKAHLYKPL